LAINSAGRVNNIKIAKIQKDIQPRLLFLKFCSLRLVIGLSVILSYRRHLVLTFKINSRIDDHVHDVTNEVHDKTQEREKKE